MGLAASIVNRVANWPEQVARNIVRTGKSPSGFLKRALQANLSVTLISRQITVLLVPWMPARARSASITLRKSD